MLVKLSINELTLSSRLNKIQQDLRPRAEQLLRTSFCLWLFQPLGVSWIVTLHKYFHRKETMSCWLREPKKIAKPEKSVSDCTIKNSVKCCSLGTRSSARKEDLYQKCFWLCFAVLSKRYLRWCGWLLSELQESLYNVCAVSDMLLSDLRDSLTESSLENETALRLVSGFWLLYWAMTVNMRHSCTPPQLTL